MNGLSVLEHATQIVLRQAEEPNVGVDAMVICLTHWSETLHAVNDAVLLDHRGIYKVLVDKAVSPASKAIAALACLVNMPWRSIEDSVRITMVHFFNGFASVNSSTSLAAWRVCEMSLRLQTCKEVVQASQAAISGVVQSWTTGTFPEDEARHACRRDAVVVLAVDVVHSLLLRPEDEAHWATAQIVLQLLDCRGPMRDHLAFTVVDELVKNEAAFRRAKKYRRRLRLMMMLVLDRVLNATGEFSGRLALLACEATVKHLSDKMVKAVRSKLTRKCAIDILDVVYQDDQPSSDTDDQPSSDTDSMVGDDESQTQPQKLPRVQGQPEPRAPGAEQVFQAWLDECDGDEVTAAMADDVAKRATPEMAVKYARKAGPHRNDFVFMCALCDLLRPDDETLCAGLDPSYVEATRFVRAKYARMSTPPKNLWQARQRFVNMFFENLDDDDEANRVTKFQMACIMYAHQGPSGGARGDRASKENEAFQRCLLLPFALLGQRCLKSDRSRKAKYVGQAVDLLHESKPKPRRVVVLHLGLGEMKTVAKSLEKMAASRPYATVVHVEYNASMVVGYWKQVNDMVMHGARILMLNAESIRVQYAAHTARNAYVVTAWRLCLYRDLEMGNMFQHAPKLPAVFCMLYSQRITGLEVVESDPKIKDLTTFAVARRDAGGETQLLEAIQDGVCRCRCQRGGSSSSSSHNNKRGATGDADGVARPGARPRLSM